ncbi:MAG: hypothetical protein R6V28_13140 [Nitriliruptoraceae bacterium]
MTNWTRIVALVAAVAAVAVLVFVLTGPDEARPGPDGVVSVAIEGTEFIPSRLVLPAGEPITLEFENRNDFIHHLAVGRSLQQTEEGAEFSQDLLAGVSAEADPERAWLPPTEEFDNVTLVLPEETTVTYELTLPEDRAGTWEVGCFVGRGCDARLLESAEVVVE